MGFFIQDAYAQGAAPAGDPWLSMLPLVIIFVVFYFLLIRPQQQKMKQHRQLLSGIRRNDRVLTGGGIIGTVTKVTGDREVAVEIADGVRVRVLRSMIAEVMAKTEPGDSDKGEKAEKQAERAAEDKVS